MRVTIALAFIALVAVAAAGSVQEQDQLPPANFAGPNVKVFDSNAELAKALKEKKSIVCFYNARCPHCKEFAPEFVKAAQEAPKDVQYVALDAELHGDIPAGFSFKYYPAIFYVDAQGNRVLYQDSRNAFTLANFVKQAAGNLPTLVEGVTIQSHYEHLQTVREHPTDCLRSGYVEEPAALMEAQSTVDASVQEHMADSHAYDGNEEAMMAREAESLKQWERPAKAATAPVAASLIATQQEAKVEEKVDPEVAKELAMEESMDKDMDMDMGELEMEQDTFAFLEVDEQVDEQSNEAAEAEAEEELDAEIEELEEETSPEAEALVETDAEESTEADAEESTEAEAEESTEAEEATEEEQ